MPKVIYGKLNTAPKAKTKNVKVKRVRDINGQITTIRIIEAGSRTLPADLTDVFRVNVARARKANKQKLR